MQMHQLRLIGAQPLPQLRQVMFNLSIDVFGLGSLDFVADVNVHERLWTEGTLLPSGKCLRFYSCAWVEAKRATKVALWNPDDCSRANFFQHRRKFPTAPFSVALTA